MEPGQTTPSDPFQFIQKVFEQRQEQYTSLDGSSQQFIRQVIDQITATMRQEWERSNSEKKELRDSALLLEDKLRQQKEDNSRLQSELAGVQGKCEIAQRQLELINKDYEGLQAQMQRKLAEKDDSYRNLQGFAQKLEQGVLALQNQRDILEVELEEQKRLGYSINKELEEVKVGYESLQIVKINKTLSYEGNNSVHRQHQLSLPTPTHTPQNDSFAHNQSSISSQQGGKTLQQQGDGYEFKYSPAVQFPIDDRNSLDRESESELVLFETPKQDDNTTFRRSFTGSQRRKTIKPPLSKKDQQSVTDRLNSIFKERVQYKKEAQRKYEHRITEYQKTIKRKDQEIDGLKKQSIKSTQQSPVSRPTREVSCSMPDKKDKGNVKALSKKEERIMHELNLRKDMHLEESMQWKDKYERLRKDHRKMSENFLLKNAEAAALEQQLSQAEASFNQERSLYEQKIEMMSAKHNNSNEWEQPSPNPPNFSSQRRLVPCSPRRHSVGGEEQFYYRQVSEFNFHTEERLPTLEEEDPNTNRSRTNTQNITESLGEEEFSRVQQTGSVPIIPNLGDITNREETPLGQACTERQILSSMHNEFKPKQELSEFHEALNDFRVKQLEIDNLGEFYSYRPTSKILGVCHCSIIEFSYQGPLKKDQDTWTKDLIVSASTSTSVHPRQTVNLVSLRQLSDIVFPTPKTLVSVESNTYQQAKDVQCMTENLPQSDLKEFNQEQTMTVVSETSSVSTFMDQVSLSMHSVEQIMVQNFKKPFIVHPHNISINLPPKITQSCSVGPDQIVQMTEQGMSTQFTSTKDIQTSMVKKELSIYYLMPLMIKNSPRKTQIQSKIVQIVSQPFKKVDCCTGPNQYLQLCNEQTNTSSIESIVLDSSCQTGNYVKLDISKNSQLQLKVLMQRNIKKNRLEAQNLSVKLPPKLTSECSVGPDYYAQLEEYAINTEFTTTSDSHSQTAKTPLSMHKSSPIFIEIPPKTIKIQSNITQMLLKPRQKVECCTGSSKSLQICHQSTNTLYEELKVIENSSQTTSKSMGMFICLNPELQIKIHPTHMPFLTPRSEQSHQQSRQDSLSDPLPVELIEEDFIVMGGLFRRQQDPVSFNSPSQIEQQLFVSIQSELSNNSDEQVIPFTLLPPQTLPIAIKQQQPKEEMKAESTRTLAMTSDRTTRQNPPKLQPLTFEVIDESISSNKSRQSAELSHHLKATPYCPNTTKANSRVLSSIQNRQRVLPQIQEDVLSYAQLQCVMDHMYDVRRVEWVECYEREWSQLKEFNLSRHLYVVQVANSSEKIVLWQGKVLRMNGPSNNQFIKMSPLQQIQMVSCGTRLILGNCQLVIQPPRMSLNRANKRSYFLGDMPDGQWLLSRVTAYRVLPHL